MALDSYSDLVAAIVDRMNDASLEDQAPEFIRLAEASFNRRLFNLESEGTAKIAADASIPLPTDFLTLKTIWLDTDPRTLLQPMSQDDLSRYYAFQTTGKPQNYAFSADQLVLAPSPDDTYTVTMTYVRSLAPLSEVNTTNWLLEKHPDLYLYGALVEAEIRGWNDERAAGINARVEGIIAEINQSGLKRRTAGGMRMRSSVQERI